MARIRFHGQVNLHLPGHVTTQIHLAEGRALVGEVKNDGAGQLVVGHAGPVGGLENVDAVPFAGALGARVYTWMKADQP